MQKLVTLLGALLIISSPLVSQTNAHLIFPDSLKMADCYFSPHTMVYVRPPVIGILNAGQPFDSLYSYTSLSQLWQLTTFQETPAAARNFYQEQTGFKIIIDTTQEITQQKVFYTSPEYLNLSENLQYIQVINDKDRVKKVKCKDGISINFIAYPVYIFNSSVDTLHSIDKDLTINLTQEILDRHGNWRAVEKYKTGSCGMTWGWRPILPGQAIITCAFKYKGAFKTLARIRLDNGTIFYSEPYTVSIDEEILSHR